MLRADARQPITRPAIRYGCSGWGERLLRAVEGIDLVELPDAEQCCGFGGTFALKNPAVSADKMAAVRATSATTVTAGDASCLLHIEGGLSRLDTGVGTRHLAEILASTKEAR